MALGGCLGGEGVQGVAVFADDDVQGAFACGEFAGGVDEFDGEFGGVVGGLVGDAGGGEQGGDPGGQEGQLAGVGGTEPDAVER